MTDKPHYMLILFDGDHLPEAWGPFQDHLLPYYVHCALYGDPVRPHGPDSPTVEVRAEAVETAMAMQRELCDPDSDCHDHTAFQELRGEDRHLILFRFQYGDETQPALELVERADNVLPFPGRGNADGA